MKPKKLEINFWSVDWFKLNSKTKENKF